jgi:hypothetical protein
MKEHAKTQANFKRQTEFSFWRRLRHNWPYKAVGTSFNCRWASESFFVLPLTSKSRWNSKFEVFPSGESGCQLFNFHRSQWCCFAGPPLFCIQEESWPESWWPLIILLSLLSFDIWELMTSTDSAVLWTMVSTKGLLGGSNHRPNHTKLTISTIPLAGQLYYCQRLRRAKS